MSSRVIPESEWKPLSEWVVIRNKYPCCGKATRLDGHAYFNQTVEKQCPRCFVWWLITYSMSEWAEQHPFIKTTFERRPQQ